MYTAQSLITWPDVISAAAAAINVILVAVLVVITWRYASSTANILEESRKARQAAEQQVTTAQAQASAAQSQATAAYETLHLLREEIQDLSGLGRGIVQSAIQSTISAIEYWKRQSLKDLAQLQSFPPTDGLVPANANSAVEHARRISPSGAQLLSAAFDNLRRTREEIERIKQAGLANGPVGTTSAILTSEYEKYLTSAMDGILKAQKYFAEMN